MDDGKGQDEFTWRDSDNIIIGRVDAIAVYSNPKGDVVIRQQDPMGDDDAFIILPRNQVEQLILALRSEIAP